MHNIPIRSPSFDRWVRWAHGGRPAGVVRARKAGKVLGQARIDGGGGRWRRAGASGTRRETWASATGTVQRIKVEMSAD